MTPVRPIEKLPGDVNVMHIQNTSLPPFVKTILCRAGYNEVEEILALTEQELLELPGFGNRSYMDWLMWGRRLGILKKETSK